MVPCIEACGQGRHDLACPLYQTPELFAEYREQVYPRKILTTDIGQPSYHEQAKGYEDPKPGCIHTIYAPGTTCKICAREKPLLPTDAAERKNAPICRGVLDYFPRALAAVANLSRVGNEQHNPGEPMHWAKEKSTDEADCIVRHLIERGRLDSDGVPHSAKVAWRALAMLERELEAEQ